jgi:hypothetical protein
VLARGARVLAELSNAEAAIGDGGAKPITSPYLADLLLPLFDTTKFHSRRTLRFLRRHASTNVFFYQHIEVGRNLLVEMYIHKPK